MSSSVMAKIRSDQRTNGPNGMLTVLMLILYRLGHHLSEAAKGKGKIRRIPLGLLRRFLQLFYSWLAHSFGCFLPFSVRLGERVEFRHGFYGVFISQAASIGDDVIILNNVTIGSNPGSDGRQEAPTVGKGVFIGSGAILFGDITIGDGARIGANATVVDDVPAGATVVPVKARVIEKQTDPS